MDSESDFLGDRFKPLCVALVRAMEAYMELSLTERRISLLDYRECSRGFGMGLWPGAPEALSIAKLCEIPLEDLPGFYLYLEQRLPENLLEDFCLVLKILGMNLAPNRSR